jgi:hypothetical protein
MSENISLKQAERKVFATSYADGLWDIFLGCFILEFAIAPLLSNRLGDFWSSAIFLPFWGLVFIVIWLVRKVVVKPRLGLVVFGKARRTRLLKFNIVMLIVNGFMLIFGILAALYFRALPGWLLAIIFGLGLLVGFSLTAYFLSFLRLYIYGILVALCPPVGEWLYINWNASHHGFPITFGFMTGIMILTGLVIFIHFLRTTPVPNVDNSVAEVNNG